MIVITIRLSFIMPLPPDDDEKKSVAVAKTARKKSTTVAFELRDMISFIDGCSSSSPLLSPFSDLLALHKNVLADFDSLADFLCQNTRTTRSGEIISEVG